jgi:hypothetical protein
MVTRAIEMLFVGRTTYENINGMLTNGIIRASYRGTYFARSSKYKDRASRNMEGPCCINDLLATDQADVQKAKIKAANIGYFILSINSWLIR